MPLHDSFLRRQVEVLERPRVLDGRSTLDWFEDYGCSGSERYQASRAQVLRAAKATLSIRRDSPRNVNAQRLEYGPKAIFRKHSLGSLLYKGKGLTCILAAACWPQFSKSFSLFGWYVEPESSCSQIAYQNFRARVKLSTGRWMPLRTATNSCRLCAVPSGTDR